MATIRGTNADDFLLGDDIATGIGDRMNGLGGNDIMEGRAGNDSMSGDAGNDTLRGGDGNDILDGGQDGTPGDDKFLQDSDTLDGGSGTDTLSMTQIQHGMFVNLFQGLASGKGNVDFLTSIENITATQFDDNITGDNNKNAIQAGNGNDRVDGAGGNDVIDGSSGKDTVIGGTGKDLMFGGGDQDRFVFEGIADSGVGAANRDRISGFVSGTDKIDVSQIDAQASSPGLAPFTFIGDAKFTAEGQVRAVFDGTNTIVALNTTGNSGAESQIELAGDIDLSASDFFL